MKYAGKTDIGQTRQNNQDSFQVIARDDYLCAVVCDGMGGANGGNVASSVAARAFCSRIKKCISQRQTKRLSIEDTEEMLKISVDEANEKVYNKALYEPGLEGMGTTLAAVLVTEYGAEAMNIGDSRIYACKDGELRQVSEDHSFVQYLIKRGAITPEEARTHPNRNIILKAVGIGENVSGDTFFIPEFDYLLLCTDGLTNHVEDFEIRNILNGTLGKKISLKRKAETLVALANSRGGYDNITAVIIGR